MEIALSLYKWKVFYADETYLSSNDMSPYSIPFGRHEGVQVIIQPNPEHIWETLSGHNYYYWEAWSPEPAMWHGSDYDGLTYYLRNPGFKCVLYGTYVSKERYREIFNLAHKELGEKTGFDPSERHP